MESADQYRKDDLMYHPSINNPKNHLTIVYLMPLSRIFMKFVNIYQLISILRIFNYKNSQNRVASKHSS